MRELLKLGGCNGVWALNRCTDFDGALYNRRYIVGILSFLLALTVFFLSPSLSYAEGSDEPHGQVLRVLLNAYHATVEESFFTLSGGLDPNDVILDDLKACNEAEDFESFMAWYALQDGSEDSYLDIKAFADWDDHRALKAWNKYMFWLSEQIPPYDAYSYTQFYDRYVISGGNVYNSGGANISRVTSQTVLSLFRLH